MSDTTNTVITTAPAPNTTAIVTDAVAIETAITTSTSSKPFYLSVTLWGALILSINQVLPHLGVKFDDVSSEAIAQGIVTVIGAGLTVYGRIKASKNLSTK